MKELKAKLAYTIGEPAGIGADIILQTAVQQPLADVVCLADKELLKLRAEQLGLDVELLPAHSNAKAGQLSVEHLPLAKPAVCGVPSTENVAAVLTMLDTAIDGCRTGRYAAMVTGPLHKGIINDAGIAFSGHTEYLAERCQAPLPVMMLATDRLRVALVTTHLPLRAVADAISIERVMQICTIVDRDLQQKFGIERPRLLVCGLNPHAGEGGHLGHEEIEIINPALQRLREAGLNVTGPLPADTLFTPRYLAQADAVVAMYHDQGLPVLKALGFGAAANITLGLPIVRTSVDHGTAFDLAGSGQAECSSLQVALSVARQMAIAMQ